MKFESITALDLPVHQAKSLAFEMWPYLISLLFLSPSLYWIAQDHSVWPWDQAWYGQVSADLWFTLVNSPAEWLPAMWKAFGSKAPGIAWVGQWFVPIGRNLGSIESGLLLSILVVQFGSVVLIYKLGKEFLTHAEFAFLGCLMLLSAPLFVGMSHQYLTEPLQLFAVTYLYWIAARARFWRGSQITGHLVLASGLGLASKVTFPLYCFIPGCIALYEARKGKEPAKPHTSPYSWTLVLLALAGIAVLGNVLLWYVKNGRTLIGFVKLASSSDIALYYGSSGNFLYKVQYWIGALQKSLAMPSVLLGVSIVFLIATGIRFANTERCRPLPCTRLTLLAAGAFVHVILVLTTFALNVNEESRYLLPLLPSVVVMFLWCVAFVQMRSVLVLTALLFIGQWAYVESRAFGFVPPNDGMSHWVLPVQTNKGKMDELSRIVQLTCTPENTKGYSVAGIELPWLNANSLSFYASKWKLDSKLPCYFTSLGYAEKDPDRAWKRVNNLNIEYFISLEETALPQLPNILNEVSLPVLKRIQADHRFTQLPYDSKYHVVIFENSDNTESTR